MSGFDLDTEFKSLRYTRGYSCALDQTGCDAAGSAGQKLAQGGGGLNCQLSTIPGIRSDQSRIADHIFEILVSHAKRSFTGYSAA
jgi:hypothetical protein